MTPRALRNLFITLAVPVLALTASQLRAQEPGQEPGQVPVQPPIQSTAPEASRVEPASVSAQGAQRSVVTVPSFGRYAVWAESERGVALQLVDRMKGPGAVTGEVGVENGRVDLFLDRGDYLVRTFGAETGVGDEQAQVRAVRFVEQQPDPVKLLDQKLIRTELGDLEERSWWLQVRKGRRVVLEAAGRHLQDLRLWRDGSWLVDVAPSLEIIEPREGQPLRLARLAIRLSPGLYRVTAYGGVGVPWPEDDGSKPLVLRSGVPKVSESARRRLEISDFGFDRFLVPGPANYFRIESAVEGPAGENVSIERGWWQHDEPFARAEQRSEIVKENRFPVAEIETWSDDDDKRWHLVTVRGQAGESLLLQHFRSVEYYPFKKAGRYLISTVSSGPAGDAIDASALMVRRIPGKHLAVTKSRATRLHDGVEWRRRFNLPERATLYLQAETAGRYEIRGGGDATVSLRLEPFFAPGTEPRDYEAPPFRDDGDIWDLDKGFYVLTLEPRRAGI